MSEGPDNVVELIRAGAVDLVINTPFGRAPRIGRLVHPHRRGGGRACRASPRCPASSPPSGGSRRSAATRPNRARSRSTTPRRADRPSQARLTFDAAAAAEAGRRRPGGVKRVRAEILSTRTLGAYHSLTLVAPEIAERARPGQFVAVAMPEDRDFLLRRHLTIHQSSRRGGWAGTLEFVVDPAPGPAPRGWPTSRAHEFLDVIGPLGKPFSYPKRLTNCLLVGEGRSVAGLYFLAQELVGARQARRHGDRRVDARHGVQADRGQAAVAARHGRDRRRHARRDAAPSSTRSSRRSTAASIEVVYAAGTVPLLRGGRGDLPCAEAPGTGRRGGADGVRLRPVRHLRGAGRVARTAAGWDHVRACVDGPVFNPARVRLGPVAGRRHQRRRLAEAREPAAACGGAVMAQTPVARGRPRRASRPADARADRVGLRRDRAGAARAGRAPQASAAS